METPPPARTGPHPLPLYLGLAQMLWLNSPGALLCLKNASPLLKDVPEQTAHTQAWAALNRHLAAQRARDPHADEKFEAALAALGTRQYSLFLDGVERYRHSAFTRSLNTPPVLWQSGTTRLLDFSQGAEGGVALMIPSLINRYHVLDLDEGFSFARFLSQRGFRPLVIDWGEPGETERGFDTDAYCRERLVPILEQAMRLQGGAVHLVGYCMGGLFAAACAALKPHALRSLMFLATPWDFQAEGMARAGQVAEGLRHIAPLLQPWGEMPRDVLQSFFISQHPFTVLDKFLRLAATEKNSAEERAFVLVEDWVNDGVPLAAPLAQECLEGWYAQNRPLKGTWQVMGKPVRPERMTMSSLHVIPAHDRIVPPSAALALARIMPQARTLQPDAGHISMMTHVAARDKLWPLLADWLALQ